MSTQRPTAVAILAAYNEEDIIGQVVRALIAEDVQVYLIDNRSTDRTVAEVEPYVGRGVIGIERFPAEDASTPEEQTRLFVWESILRRKQALAQELRADWFIHHDADEFRESPWEGLRLRDAIERVDAAGYNAIDFHLLNFWPTDGEPLAAGDVRDALTRYEPAQVWNQLQVKCWKNTGQPIDLVSSGGHDVAFKGRRVFPIRFLLRHYPIRSQAHGALKVFRDRVPRFAPAERARGWHVQYDEFPESAAFVHDADSLITYDPVAVRLDLVLWHREVERLEQALDHATALAQSRVEDLQNELAQIHPQLLDLLRSASDGGEQRPADRGVYLAKDGAGKGPRLLVLTDTTPTPDLDAGSYRLFQLMKLLTELGLSVTLATDQGPPERRYIDMVRSLGIPIYCGSKAVMAHLSTEGHEYECVFLSRPEMAFQYMFAVRAHATRAKVMYDTVDLHWVRMQGAADLLHDQATAERAKHYKRIETLSASASDVVLAVTAQEKATLMTAVPGVSVAELPNIHPHAETGGPWQTRRDLMFIGGFWHQPNEDAVCYFVDEVLPIIRRDLPDVVFNIIGSRVPDRVKALASDSVRVLGYVPDPTPYFTHCRVFVAPLRFGAGMKGKVGQSMSHALPVVTTSIGAEGMMLVDGETALIADDTEGFARAVVRLYTDERLWTAMAQRSASHIAEHFSEAAALRRLAAIFWQLKIALPPLAAR